MTIDHIKKVPRKIEEQNKEKDYLFALGETYVDAHCL